jgi:glycosyltransferase involved in cell wall biosynthesis
MLTVAHLRLMSPKNVWGSVWERTHTFRYLKEFGVEVDYYYADNDIMITPEGSLKYDILNIGEFSFGTWQEAFIRAHPHPVIMVQETSLNSLLNGSKGLDLNIIRTKPCFIALTNWSRDLLIHVGINGDKITVIPCAADMDNFKPGTVETSMQKPVFLYVGSFNKKKGAHHAVTAFAKVGTGTLLMVQGEFNNDDSDHITKLIHYLNINDKIIIKPFPSLDKLAQYFQMCDVVIYPQSYEDGEPIQFGHPLLWGMSCGLPLISLNMGGAKDLIMNGANGFLCNSYEDLASAMKQLASDHDMRLKFGRASRELAETRFHPMVISKGYFDFYKRVMEI